ncbi:hypothetical protein ACQP6C_11975 [Snodgrassella alvi]|uniref:hypothetical protein n=1 Tax=Snodgrassella alvi TaxID=1196083 RepID=UPI003CFC8B96
MTTDQQIASDLIKRQLDTIRVEIGLENELLSQIEQLKKDITALIAGVDLTTLTKAQLNELLKRIEKAINDFYADCTEQMQQTINDIGDNEARYLPRLFILATDGNSGIKILSDAQITSLTAGILLGGLTLKETFAVQEAQLFNAVKRQIRTGAVDGVIPDLAGVFKKTNNWIKATVPTATGAIRNQIIYAFGRINSKVKGWQHYSIIDERTSAICFSRNHLIWDKDKQPIGHDQIFQLPPLHCRCRSSVLPLTDLQAESDGMTNEKWINSRSLAQLQEQFGKGIGKMLKSGEVTIADIVKNGGLQPMTLTELKEKYH